MNAVLILPEELSSEGTAVLCGQRAAYARAAHDLKVGLRLRAARWCGKRGHVLVKELSAERVVLEAEFSEEPLPIQPIELIAAVPRPQTVKKVLQLAAAAGVRRVHLVRTQNVVKSYLSSKGLRPEAVRMELIKGLEQSGASSPPEVLVHARFRPFMEDVLGPALSAAGSAALGIVASTRACLPAAALRPEFDRPRTLFVAVGPESGWSEHEERELAEAAFRPITLGPRMFRVETAVAWILGQLDVLMGLFDHTKNC